MPVTPVWPFEGLPATLLLTLSIPWACDGTDPGYRPGRHALSPATLFIMNINYERTFLLVP